MATGRREIDGVIEDGGQRHDIEIQVMATGMREIYGVLQDAGLGHHI